MFTGFYKCKIVYQIDKTIISQLMKRYFSLYEKSNALINILLNFICETL